MTEPFRQAGISVGSWGSYVPGSWFAVAGHSAVVLVAGSVSSERLLEIWSCCTGHPSLDELIEVITGGRVVGAPAFGLGLLVDAEIRIVVRTGVTAQAGAAQDGRTVSSAGKNTWAEEVAAAGPIRLFREIPTAPVLTLPIQGGIVHADAITWTPAPLPSPGREEQHASSPTGSWCPPPDPDESPGVLEPHDAVLRSASPEDTGPDEFAGLTDFFGRTTDHSVEDAAVREDEDTATHTGFNGPELLIQGPPKPSAPSGQTGDHDGMTVRGDEGQALRKAIAQRTQQARSSVVPEQADSSSPMAGSGLLVPAVVCTSQHLSPPQNEHCRVCAAPLAAQEPVMCTRPELGALHFSTGLVVPVDRPVIIGRAPSVNRVQWEDIPRPVRLDDPDVSRNHLEVRLEGWHVLAVDLKSANGTIVTIPGRAPRRLVPGEPFLLAAGTEISLSDEMSFRYRVAG